MKSIIPFVAVLLQVYPAVAEPMIRDGIMYEADGAPLMGRDWVEPSFCTTDAPIGSVVSLMEDATTASFDASSFCSENLRPTVAIRTTITSDGGERTRTATQTSSVFTTTTDYATRTITDICPTPSTSMTCGVSGSGNSANFVSFIEPLEAPECQQRCLSDGNCKSFQLVEQYNGQRRWLRCNLYNAPASQVIFNGPGLFYDRDCQDLLPTFCGTPTRTTVEAISPAEPTAEAVRRAEDVEKRDVSTPSFLATVPPERVWLACECIITAAAEPVTVTITAIHFVYSTTSTTVTKSESYTLTDRPNWSTIYTTGSA